MEQKTWGGGGRATDGLWLRAFAFPICSQGFIARACCWTHVNVVYQASMNSRVLFVVPFPTTEALVQSNVWPVLRQCRARREFSSCRLTALWCSFIRVANWRPVWPTWALGHSEQGMLYKTFCRLYVGRGSFALYLNTLTYVIIYFLPPTYLMLFLMQSPSPFVINVTCFSYLLL